MTKNAQEARRGRQIRGTVRLFEALLEGKRLTRHAAAEILDAKAATADRQLREIRAIKGVRYEKTETFFDKALLLDPASYPAAVSACLMAGLSRLFRGTAYEGGMNAALNFIINRNVRRIDFQDLERKFVFTERGGETSLPEKHETLDDLVESILRQRHVRIRYSDFSGADKTVRGEPLTLVIHDHQLYVIVRRADEKFRPVRFSRIKKLTELGSQFSYPVKTHYDPGQLLAQVFGIFVGVESRSTEVKLRFSPKWRTYADTHRWHPSQQVEPDGKWFTMRMQLRPCHEFETWIRGFGADVEVIEPRSLRNKIARMARATAAKYAEKKSSTHRKGNVKGRRSAATQVRRRKDSAPGRPRQRRRR